MSDHLHDSNSFTLSRDLSLIDVTLIGVGAMIGAGIFVLTGIAAGQAGPALLLVLLLNGLITTITACSYAELGSCFPQAGGGYAWVTASLGGLAGFVSGWMSWFAHAVACSLYALGFGAYLAALAADLHWLSGSPQEFEKPFAVIITLLFAFINYRGAKETGRVGNFVTLAKIAILGIFIAFGLVTLSTNPTWPTHFDPFFANGAAGVLAAMGLTFIAFEGYEIIAQSGEEVKNPRRNIPRAIFASIGIAVIIYLMVAFVAIAAVDGHGLPTWQYLGQAGETALIEAARQLLPGGPILIIIAGLLSTLSALNATIYSSSRVSFAMGRDRVLPDAFGAVHPQRRTPYWAIWASAALMISMAVALPLKDVASAADIVFLLLFALVNASVIRLRRQQPDLERGFRVPFMPALPVLGIGLMIGLAIYLFSVSPQAWLSALAWIGVGTVIYYLYSARRTTVPRAPIVEAHLSMTRDFRVLLPVAKPERADQLAPLAAALAGAYQGEVLVMNVEVVPMQSPLNVGQHFVHQTWPAVTRASQLITDRQVPTHSMMRIGHDAVSGIVEAAREIKANAMVVGWRPRPHTADRFLGPTLDPLIANPPCDVLVLRAETIDTPRRILVPMAGGPNATLALSYALQLAEYWDGQVTALTVVNPSATADQATAAQHILHEALSTHRDQPRLSTKIANAATPTEGILQAAAEHDLVMIGASRESTMIRVLFGMVPERVAMASPAPVIVVKRRVGIVAHWSRRIGDRALRWFPQLNDAQRTEVYKAIRRAAWPDVDYFVMIGLAAGIASLGLLLNSPAVIIGAMLVAPLMAAIVGLGMGVVMGDLRLLRLATSATVRGMLLAIAVGVLAGWLAIDPTPTAEILSRTQPTLLDLGVALLSGAAGAYALCREDVSASLPGVAIAAALVPPLATVGIGLAHGNWAVAGGALLLFVTNLVAISAASVVVFLLFGFRPGAETQRINILRRGAISTIVLLVITALLLAVLTYNVVVQVQFNQAVQAAVNAEVARLDQTELVELKIDPLVQNEVHLDVTVRSPRTITHEETVTFQQDIAKRLNRTVALLLTVIPTTQLNPFVPPTPTPTPTPTSTPTPGPTPTPTNTPTSTPTPTDTLTPTSTPTATPTDTPTFTSTPIKIGQVFNTGGSRLNVHVSPGGPIFTSWAAGTPVTLIGEPQSINGRDWLHVRANDGVEGWVATNYITIVP